MSTLGRQTRMGHKQWLAQERRRREQPSIPRPDLVIHKGRSTAEINALDKAARYKVARKKAEKRRQVEITKKLILTQEQYNSLSRRQKFEFQRQWDGLQTTFIPRPHSLYARNIFRSIRKGVLEKAKRETKARLTEKEARRLLKQDQIGEAHVKRVADIKEKNRKRQAVVFARKTAGITSYQQESELVLEDIKAAKALLRDMSRKFASIRYDLDRAQTDISTNGTPEEYATFMKERRKVEKAYSAKVGKAQAFLRVKEGELKRLKLKKAIIFSNTRTFGPRTREYNRLVAKQARVRKKAVEVFKIPLDPIVPEEVKSANLMTDTVVEKEYAFQQEPGLQKGLLPVPVQEQVTKPMTPRRKAIARRKKARYSPPVYPKKNPKIMIAGSTAVLLLLALL